MSKLLIFGDSFAEEELRAFMPGHPMHEVYKRHRSWHWVVRNSGLYRSVDCHAIGGSDLWSQYVLFKQYYTGAEDVLWFETQPGRLSSPDGRDHYTNVNCVDMRLYDLEYGANRGRDRHTVELLKMARDFFMHLQRDDLEVFTHSAIIRAIKETCPHVRFIPCFEQSVSLRQTARHLSNVNMQELMGFGIDYGAIVRTHYDIRRNHMTEQNSLILGEQVVEFLRSDKFLDFDGFVTPTPRDVNTYFIPH